MRLRARSQRPNTSPQGRHEAAPRRCPRMLFGYNLTCRRLAHRLVGASVSSTPAHAPQHLLGQARLGVASCWCCVLLRPPSIEHGSPPRRWCAQKQPAAAVASQHIRLPVGVARYSSTRPWHACGHHNQISLHPASSLCRAASFCKGSSCISIQNVAVVYLKHVCGSLAPRGLNDAAREHPSGALHFRIKTFLQPF